MKSKKRVLKFIVAGIIVIIIAGLIIGLIYENDKKTKIKQANIDTYDFLKCLDSCTLTYTMDMTGAITPVDFNQDCLNRCMVYINKVPFKPGEITDESLILESTEYNNCVLIKTTKGVGEFQTCIETLLPMLKEKYPEVSQSKFA